MGNVLDAMTKFDGGYLCLRTDRPYYYASNKVKGKIYIKTQVPMSPKKMEIKVKGRE
jgi:hypothetical protein